MNNDELKPVPTETDPSEPQAEPQSKLQDDGEGSQQTADETATTNPPASQSTADETATASANPQDSQSTTVETASTNLQGTQATTVEPVSANPQDPQPITTSDAADHVAATGATTAKSKKSHKGLIIAAVIALAVLIIGGTVCAVVFHQSKTKDNSEDQPSDQPDDPSVGTPVPNRITNFDLAFLKDQEVNQLYSPLSIKYALGMLEAGAAGNSQQQIEYAIGPLTPRKYPNNKNMSFANALFINNQLPDDEIKSSYTKDINERFGAETLRVSFASATPINNWVSDKTFGLIKDLLSDDALNPVGGPEQYFALVNALAIDMEWVNKIQSYDKDYSLSFPNINYNSFVPSFRMAGFNKLSFNNSAMDVNSLRLAATVHKYDILSDLGEDKIRQTVLDEYTKWLNDDVCPDEEWPEPEVYVEEYLEQLGNGGYETVSSSTDFSFYDDDEVKVFAKDLKTYDDITLQYVGIMPKSTSLKDYTQDLTTKKLQSTIDQLKPLALENFKDGVITNIVASIPVFKFQDKLDLVDSLQGLGITDVFDATEADLSNLVKNAEGIYIGQAIHQTTVDFSNDGIKASAATALVGGAGAGGCRFSYNFDVPVEKIDLTFDNPYLFLIRDKDSGDIWFVGTVYEPTAYTESSR